MALIFDENGFVIGDDGTGNTGGVTGSWEEDTPPDSGLVASQAAKFQKVLDDVSVSIDNLNFLLTLNLPQDQRDLINIQLDEINSRKTALKFTADSLNVISDVASSVGVDLPSIRVPSGLGFAILGVPVAAAAGYAAAAALTAVVISWVVSTHSVALSAAESLSEPDRTRALQYISQQTPTSIAGDVASTVKYVALAVVAYLAFQHFNGKNNVSR